MAEPIKLSVSQLVQEQPPAPSTESSADLKLPPILLADASAGKSTFRKATDANLTLITKKIPIVSSTTYERSLREFEQATADSPTLYDLSDPQAKAIYEQVKKTQGAETVDRDTTSFDQIIKVVQEAIQKYGDGGIVIITGAAVHIHGAIPTLVKENQATYYPLTAKTLKLGDINAGATTVEKMQTQMRRSIGVEKSLGYSSLEDFYSKTKNPHPKNILIGLEETGRHDIYLSAESKERETKYFAAIERLIDQTHPAFVVVIGEDVDTKGAQQDLVRQRLNGSSAPIWQSTQRIYNKGILVIIGQFGLTGNIFENLKIQKPRRRFFQLPKNEKLEKLIDSFLIMNNRV